LQDAGFSHAAGIPFQSGGVEGIVIYYTTRSSTATTTATDTDINVNFVDGGITSVANQVYLLRATELIGAVVATIEARRAVMVMKLESAASLCSSDGRPRADSAVEPSGDDANTLDVTKLTNTTEFSTKTTKGLKVWWSKCHGGKLQIPPAMSWNQALWTFTGAFASLLLLSGLNNYILHLSEEKYFIMIGPIGAVITLQYGLTSAPAAQPRNVILGQIVAGAIALPFTYIPTWILSPWIRQAFGPACSILAMVKLGVVHPPAGAAAVIFASGSYDWIFYVLMILASVLFIFPAVLINNMSKKRQYPTYWI